MLSIYWLSNHSTYICIIRYGFRHLLPFLSGVIRFHRRLRLPNSSLTVVPISTSESLLHQLLANRKGKIRLCHLSLSRRSRAFPTFLKVDHRHHTYIVISFILSRIHSCGQARGRFSLKRRRWICGYMISRFICRFLPTRQPVLTVYLQYFHDGVRRLAREAWSLRGRTLSYTLY